VEIKIIRDTLTKESTLGKLYIDGRYFANTLEDVVRPAGEKVPNKTAIPAGRYRVIWNKSNRFSLKAGHPVFMPLILDIPGFAGVRLHSGNRAADTDGCVLVGFDRHADAISRSRDAIDALYPLIQGSKTPVWLTIG
jgi:hypothetical protein